MSYETYPATRIMLDRSIALGRLALAFSRVERVTKHEDGIRLETDSDHTVMLAIIACDLAPSGLKRALVAHFAVVHDLVEVHSGDVQTLKIDAGQRLAKAERERLAYLRLAEEFGEASDLCFMIRRYEQQKEPEARFVRLLDKVMPKITHALNGCAAAKLIVNYDGFVAAHEKQHQELSEMYPEFPEILALLRLSMDHAEACWRTT